MIPRCSICAQLICQYHLHYPSLLAHTGQDATILSRLLEEIAATRQRPVVVVVDALDEAEAPRPGYASRLCLPSALPDGVYFIVTTREQSDLGLVVDRREDIFIADNDPANLRLEGDAAVVECMLALQDVGRWWP